MKCTEPKPERQYIIQSHERCSSEGTDKGKEIGAKGVLILTGVGEGSLNEFRHTWKDVEPAYVAENVLEAVKWIIEDSKSRKN